LRIFNRKSISIGDGVSIWKRASLLAITHYNNQQFSPELIIWDNFCTGNDLFIAVTRKVTIGNDVLFADRVCIVDNIHWYTDVSIPVLYQDLASPRPIHIGSWSFVWINAVILPGVTIGKGAVIGASSVVVSDIPDYAVATGNPAKVIRQYDLDKKEWIKVL
jgi:acetyltransferase-like isoleucine patch superfamily enzyme